MTTEKGNKIPQIRFRDYSGSWRSERVSALLTERNTQAPKSELYPLMAFIAGQGVAPKGARYNREFLVSDEANKKYKQTEYGDFIYSSNNLETGSRGLNNCGKASISPVYSIFAPTAQGDSGFIGQLLCKRELINEMVKWRQGVVYGQWRIHEADFLGISVTFPSIDEQKIIGAYLKELDNVISLRRQRQSKLHALKRTMLRKLLPQDGSAVPEVRIKGYSRRWEKRKVDVIADRFDNLRRPVSASKRIAGKTPYYGANGIQDYVLGHTHEGEFILIAEDGANDLRNYPVQYVNGKVWVNNHTHVLKGKAGIAENRFLKYAFSQIDMTPYVVGGGRAKLNAETLMNIELYIPVDFLEQQRIGEFFSKIDALTEYYADQLKKLQEIKSAFLENMFA